MSIVFWIALAGIVYTYAGYPCVAWLRARWWPKPWKSATFRPSLSIIMAVHNGERLLPWKLGHLSHLDYPNLLEIIVVSDGSTDGTPDLLRKCENARIVTIILEEHQGKAAALNAGTTRARGEILLFVDIRPEIAPGAIGRLVSNFSDSRVGCATGNLVLRDQEHDRTTRAVGGLYWRYERWLRVCESLSDSTCGVYGGFYAIRRELAVPQPDGLILDDMFQPLSVIRQGFRCVIDEQATVIDSWPQRHEDEFRRKVRTLAGNFQLVQRAPWILTGQNRALFQFISHKGMRLVVPYLFVLLFVSTLCAASDSAFYAAFLATQIVGWGLAVAGLYLQLPLFHRLASAASAVFLLNVAAVVGLYRFLFTPPPLWRIWVQSGQTQRRTKLSPR
jgi:cellulose synthase/poly-beta-1,6-N-acetylglucosamine synthase-like glycosyltransferase